MLNRLSSSNLFWFSFIVRKGSALHSLKVTAAGCILPLTSKDDLSSELGTRHRAALGMSETSDAVVAVVSEETGAISIAENGKLMRNVSDGVLREVLMTNFVKTNSKEDNKIRKILRGGKDEE